MREDIAAAGRFHEALKQSDYRFLDAFKYSAIGMALISIKGRCLEVNKALCTLLNYSRGELLKLTFHDLTYPSDLSKELQHFQRLLTSDDSSFQLQNRYIDKNGKIIWAILTVSLVRDDHGDPHYFVLQLQDITDLKKEQLHQQKNKEKYSLTAENAYVETGPLQSNASLAESVEKYQTLNKKLNATLRALEQRSAQLKQTNDKLTRSQNYLTQINDQLKFKTDALDQMAIVATSDAAGNIIEVNKRFTQVTGYQKAEIIGKPQCILYGSVFNSGVHSKDFFDNIWQTLQRGKVWRGEICNKSRSGKLFWLLKTVIPMFDNEGKIISYFSFSNNITLQKKREEEIIEAKRQAEEASVIKEDFLSVMSHEIRTPLNSVIGLSNLLLKRNPREDQLEIIKTLKNASDNLVYLINDILDYNKIRAGKIELEEIQFSPLELLRQLQATYQFIAAEKGVDLKITLDPNIPECLIGDLTRLNQILNNLVDNALKFTMEGYVKVTASVRSKSSEHCNVLFEVEDSGIGISEEKMNLIFTPFQQSEKYISRKFGGTGLGLSIVKSLTELFNGQISVSSKADRGSVFSVSVPFRVDANCKVNNKQRKTDLSENALNGYRILYVEDVESNRMLVKNFFSDYQVDCVVVPDGETALFHTANKMFDVILMDLQMPGLNGYEVTQAIQQQRNGKNAKTPVIAFTAEPYSEALRAKLTMHGMVDSITKPFDFDNLLRKIVAACPRRRSKEELFTFQFYEQIFNHDRKKLKQIKAAVIRDFKLVETKFNTCSKTKDLEGMRAALHKLSPIAKNLKCVALIALIEECQAYDNYAEALKELNKKLKKCLQGIYPALKALQY